MCWAWLSVFRSKNKVAPASPTVSPLFSQGLLKRAKTQIEKENALLRKSVSTQTSQSLMNLVEKQRSQTPKWMSYDLDFNGNIVAKDGLTKYCPKKLERDPNLPTLTIEMLLEKQAQVEENRNKEIEKKRKATSRKVVSKPRKEDKDAEKLTKAERLAQKQAKAKENRQAQIAKRKTTARKSVEVKHPRNLDEEQAEKLSKAAKIAEKHMQAAENRQAQIEIVKTKANKSLSNNRCKLVDAQRFAKAQETDQQTQRKMNTVKANRERAVRRVVQKQRLRESHSQKVRARLAKQQKEEEDLANNLTENMEVDSNYYDSDSDKNDELWDDFWA